jgi:hypothetical protein
MDELIKYVRDRRPTEDDPLLFDREIRLLLNWLDTHRIREREVFEAQEGKEYAAMLQFVEERTIAERATMTQFKVDTELFQKLLAAAASAPAAPSSASAASSSSVGGARSRRRRAPAS